MASETVVSDSVDPLGGLNGPSLFPRTIRASTDRSFPADSRDLDSIHNFMKSLELQSPEKLMNEAKRIVDGGAEFLESSFASFAEKVGIADAVAAKGKDMAQERRPGLARVRKKRTFQVKASQPTVSLESSLNIDQLEDPDDFFDAYDRVEKANKEIQKQLGGSMGNLNQYNPSTNVRRRGPGILGKSYHKKHRYSHVPSENDDMLMSSQETGEQGIPSAHEDESQIKLMDVDPNPEVDLEEVELAVPMKKTENQFSEILEELLSNAEDLDEDGTLNHLQERLKFKHLDLENLCMPQPHGVRGTSSLSAGDSLLKSRKSSLIIDSVLKDVNSKSRVEHNQVPQNSVNALSSPTPPKSPHATLSLLRKKILQSIPLKDPFSPLDVDLSACDKASPVQPIGKLQEQADVPATFNMSSELKCPAEVEIKERTMNTRKVGSLPDQFVDGSIQRVHNAEETVNLENLKGSSSTIIDAQTMVGNEGSFPDQFVDKDASIQRANADGRASEVLGYNSVEVMNTESFNGTKSPSSIITDAQKVVGSDNYFADKFVDENAGIQPANADNRPNELENYNIEERMNLENLNANQSSPVIQDEVMEDPSSGHVDAEKQPKAHQATPRKERRKAGEKRIRRKSVADVLEDEATDDPLSKQDIGRACERESTDVPSTDRRADPGVLPEVNQAVRERRKRDQAGEKRIRKAHPMRKSIAESGTSFEAGVRRSKRIRMRPLEYWKGERFLYGRMDDSWKLLGVKYISPGKGNNGGLKVKPYIPSESSGYKELLDLAARH